MKHISHIKKGTILVIIILFTALIAQLMFAECKTKNHEHSDKIIARCPYSQNDIKKMHAKNPQRYHQLHIQQNSCPYCKCSINEHSCEN